MRKFLFLFGLLLAVRAEAVNPVVPYIQDTSTLQQGATFYVSSGTVNYLKAQNLSVGTGEIISLGGYLQINGQTIYPFGIIESGAPGSYAISGGNILSIDTKNGSINLGLGLTPDPASQVNMSTVTVSSITATYFYNPPNLSFCSDGSHAVGWTNGTFGCQTINVSSQTIAGLHVSTPTILGNQWYCSDCSVDAMAVATGTIRGSFGEYGSKTTFPH